MTIKSPYLYFLILGIVYFSFPTHNANIDSWFYAASVKYGQELFNSHHLLYNSIGRAWFILLKLPFPAIEAIAALNVMNAMAATLSLLIVYRILLLLKKSPETALWLSLFCGVTFGFMRFATDAETYILPLLLSLLSTYFLMRKKNGYDLLLSGLFSALSILVHQLHIWWAVAIFLSLSIHKPFKLKDLLLFSLPLILVPTLYYMVYLQLGHGSFWQFLSGEYSTGNAGISFSFKSAALVIINFFRSLCRYMG